MGDKGIPPPAVVTGGLAISTCLFAFALEALRLGKSLLTGLGGSSGEEATPLSPFRFFLGEAFALLLALELILELDLVMVWVLPFFLAMAPAPPGIAVGDEAPLRFFLDGFSVASEVNLTNVPESSLVLLGMAISAIGIWAGHLECLHPKYVMPPAEAFLSHVSPQKHDGMEAGVFSAGFLDI